MGSCSNRDETKEEKIGRFAKEIYSTRDVSSFNWQMSKGAEIRGILGVEKGNKFIKTIKKFGG